MVITRKEAHVKNGPWRPAAVGDSDATCFTGDDPFMNSPVEKKPKFLHFFYERPPDAIVTGIAIS